MALWFNASILSLELYHLCQSHSHRLAQTLEGSILILFALTTLLLSHYPKWLKEYKESYKFVGAGGLGLGIFIYALDLFSLSPTSKGYIPLLNLIDFMQVMATLTLYLWIYFNKKYISKALISPLYGSFYLFALFSLSLIYARAIHIYRDIPYIFYSLWDSLYFQTGLSLLWSLAGISLMLLSKHFIKRSWWIAGFSLLLLVVIKLFLIELSGSGTIERIVSFIAVGSLLLLIGYFVPFPPSKEQKR